jgi:hypothetical protein
MFVKPTVMRKIQLSIPDPCHENWQDMTPTEQGRYCNACAKEVIDFSQMSDSEVLHYFVKNKKADAVCGRVFPDQLGRDIAALPQKKKYWRLYYMLSAFLFFMKPAKTKAQGGIFIVTDSSHSITKLILEGGKEQSKKQYIKAVITNEEGNAVAYASIKIKGTSRGTSADVLGRFSLVKEAGEMILEISALGYTTKEITADADAEATIVLTRKSTDMNEVVVMTSCSLEKGYLRFYTGGLRVKSTKSVIDRAVDTVKNWFSHSNPAIKIYPNPVLKGSSFTIGLKLQQTGVYTIQITDAAGRLLTERKINSTVKEWKQEITVGNTWSGGVYYVKLMDEQGKFVNSGSMVVQ